MASVAGLAAAVSAIRKRMLWRGAMQVGLGCLALELVSVLGRWLHSGALPVSLASLILVIAMSVWTTSGPPLLIAVISPMFLQPFFDPPGTFADFWLRDLALAGAYSWASVLITRLRARVGRAIEDIRELQQRIQQVVDTVPVLIWRTTADGSGDFFSQRWSEYTGLALHQGLGSGWLAALHDADRPGFVEAWKAALDAGTPLEAEARLRRVDGDCSLVPDSGSAVARRPRCRSRLVCISARHRGPPPGRAGSA